MFEFQPNRPINNQCTNKNQHCNINHLNNNNVKKSVNKCQSEVNKNEKPENVNSKYGSFKMTSLTFI